MNKALFSHVMFLIANCVAIAEGTDWSAFVANSGTQTQSSIDLQMLPLTAVDINQPVFFPVSPNLVAVAPDAKTAYMANFDNNIIVIDVASNTIIGEITIPAPSGGTQPALFAIAISPDGTSIYVTDTANDLVFPYNIPTMTVGTPFQVGLLPEGIALTPAGQPPFAFVTNNASSTVSAIDLSNNTVSTIVSINIIDPIGIAITPDGTTALVVNHNDTTIASIDVESHLVNPFVDTVTGSFNDFIAITGDGTKACVTDPVNGTVYVIDLSTRAITSIAPTGAPFGIAITPDSKTALITDNNAGTVTPVDLTTNPPNPGSPIALPSSAHPFGIAVTPDQAPQADFTFDIGRPGKATTFDGSPSTSPTGTIVSYAWNFGDGNIATTSGPSVSHVYALPGNYTVTLTVTNSAGTSTFQTFTGQTVSNNGGPSASTSAEVVILPLLPAVNLQGQQELNRFLNQTEPYNLLTWSAPPGSFPITQYKVYRGNLHHLIGVVPASSAIRYKFIDPNVSPGKTYTYFVVSIDSLGEASPPVSVTVSPH